MIIKTALEKVYTTVLLIVFLTIFSFVTAKYFIPKTIWMAGNWPYPTEYYSLKKVILVILLTLLLFVTGFIYYKVIIERFDNKHLTLTNFGFILFIIAAEFLVTFIVYKPIVGDYTIIKQGIVAFVEGQKIFPDMDQFKLYPYNTHIMLIGGFFSKLINSVEWSLKLLPIFTISGSIILSSLVLKKITNFKAAHISIALSVVNIFIYLQVPIFYTHTLVVFFLPATIYSYLCLKEANTKRKKVTWCILLGIFAACTYIIRPTALSVAFAILLEVIFKYNKEKSNRVIMSLVLCIVLIIGFKGTLSSLGLSTDNNVEKMPYSHWVKMGLNVQSYGVWNMLDVTYPKNINNTQDRDEYNKKIIVQRLKDLGPIGYAKHLNEKIERLWVSSQFSSYRLGEWFEQKNRLIFTFVADFSSTPYKIFNIYSFSIKLFLLIGTLAAAFLYKKLNKDEAEVLRICMTSTIIVFVFLLLWETAPHYSFEAFALMNIPASVGYYLLFKMLSRKRRLT